MEMQRIPHRAGVAGELLPKSPAEAPRDICHLERLGLRAVIFDENQDGFLQTRPTTTVAKWEDGETRLTQFSGEALDYWLDDYTLGALYTSGQLEGMD